MNFRHELNKKNEQKYEPGFKAEWLEDKELLERAKEKADFFDSAFKNLNIEKKEDKEIVAHFVNDDSLEKIQATKKIVNKSRFYNCDREYLKKMLDIDLDFLDNKFGNPKCTVAIPIRFFDKWTKTLSWLKLVKAGVVNNAIIFSVSKKDLIFREHKTVNDIFKHNVAEEDFSKVRNKGYKNLKEYYESTSFGNEAIESFEMPEVWISKEINLDDVQIIKS